MNLKPTLNISGIHSCLEEAFEFCWSLFTDEHKTLPKSTRRNVKSNKFAFGTLWLPDLLCKHWYTCVSSIRNFCHWVANILPCKTSPVARSEEKRLFSQAIQNPRLWNWAWGIQNLSNNWNPESKFYWQWIHNTVLGIWNPQHWIQNPRLSWIILHGTIFKTAHHVVFWCSLCKHQPCRYSEGNF